MEPVNFPVQSKVRIALALHQQGKLDEAEEAYQGALHLDKSNAFAMYQLGGVYYATQRYERAVDCISQAIEINPNVAMAHFYLGNSFLALNRLHEAAASFDKAIALNSQVPEAHNNRGNALIKLKRFDEAVANLDRAITLKPDYAEAYNNRGNALVALHRLDDALADYDRVIGLNPDSLDVMTNHGALLCKMNRPTEALASLDRAIALNPRDARAWAARGWALYKLNQSHEAAASFRTAFAINPEYEFLLGDILYAKAKVCDWKDLEKLLADCIEGVREGRHVTPPWSLLFLVDDPALHHVAARVFSRATYPLRGDRPITQLHSGKLRIGYYSADFHDHPTPRLMAEMLEAHDRTRFEIHGFTFGPDSSTDMRKRIGAAFDKFTNVRGFSDKDVALLSQKLCIDIAVDLKGHTADSRPGIFAQGCAPIQVQHVGYPGTMGTPYIDYIIADRIVLPPLALRDYNEKAVWLPHSYQPNDSTREISARIFTRGEVGLPQTGFVFCCFNNCHKIQPATFDSWMRILKAVDASVLWLLEDNPIAAENLRQEALARGINSSRLVLGGRLDLGEHLARHRLADLFLDTWPYNAHTTASDALWAGVPVLTLMGKSFASRVAASLLMAVDLPELITHSAEDYEAMAIALALNPNRLTALKEKLAKNRATSPLFDGKLIARHIEAAYEAMLARAASGLPPDNINIMP